jgi:hypothetical protein
MRREGGTDEEGRSAKTLLRALSALLFVLSVFVQAANTAASAAPVGGHWLCAKSDSAATRLADSAGDAGRHSNFGVDRCDHCVVGQAPIVPDAITQSAFYYPVEACDGLLVPACLKFFSRKLASARLPRAPPSLS